MQDPEMLGTIDLHDPGSFKVHLAVVQPTPFCNIQCKYCYLSQRNSTNRMTSETVEQVFRFLLAEPHRLARKLVVAWHAGEPLTMPIEFYQAALHAQQRLAPAFLSIENSLQTNAILLDDAWCKFIKLHNIHIGVSVDGPQFLHDANRVDRRGLGTFERVMRGMELLRAHEIDFTAMAVLSRQSLDHAEEIWKFFRQLGVKTIAFNCEDIEGTHRASSLDEGTSFARLQDFFRTLQKLRSEQAPSVEIRELDHFLEGIPRWDKEFRRIDNVPLAVIGIAWNGDVSTFAPELIGMHDLRYGDCVFGNIAGSTWDTLLSNPKFRAAYCDIAEGVRQCRERCEYFCMCGGGQPSSKLFANGSFATTETLSCRLRIKAIGQVALEILEREHNLLSNEKYSVPQRVARIGDAVSCRPDSTGQAFKVCA